MKTPKGFAKSYFSLSSSVISSLESKKIQYQTSKYFNFLQGEDFDEDAPPTTLDNINIQQNKKPCHCQYYFKVKTRLMLLLNHYIPRCSYYTTYFAYRRTGVHPPFNPFY